ncbi:MAG: hypothetical protein MMC33_001568 [Icmadophila ericetorum]|nr:hypothetical protein [Icmadophila ericetorum]
MSSFTFADWTYLPKQQYYVPPKELAQANIKPPAPQRTLEEIIADINRTEPYQMPIQKKQQINQKVNILRPSKSRMTAGATASRRLIPKIPGYCGPAEAAVLYRALEKEYEEVRNGWYDPIYPIRIIDDREFTKEDLHRERRRFFKEMTGRATPPPPDDECWKRNWDEVTGEEYYDERKSGRNFIPKEAWDLVISQEKEKEEEEGGVRY